MKFNVLAWSEITNAQSYKNKLGVLHVMSEKAVAVYVEVDGIDALVGVGNEVKAEISAPHEVKIVGDPGRAFLYQPIRETPPARLEKFTNVDRKPHESGTMAEITKAMRQFALQQNAALRELRIERAKLDKLPKPPKPPKPVEVAPVGVPEPGEPVTLDPAMVAEAENEANQPPKAAPAKGAKP